RAALQTDVGATANLFYSHLAADCGTFFTLPLFGRNDALLQLQAAVPVRGRFVITYSPPSGSMPTITYWVDVGDDGSLESSNLLGTQPLLPISFGPGTFPVRMSNYAGWTLNDDNTAFVGGATLTLRFVPDSGCTAVQVAPACGAVSLVPRQNFTLGTDQQVENLLPANGLAAMVYGFQLSSTPLPLPPGCVLATTPDAVRLLFADRGGRAMHSIATVPSLLRPCAIFAQAVDLDTVATTLATSAAFRIDCR